MFLSIVQKSPNMTKSIHHLFPPARLPQSACLALLALHQTHHPLISAWTFVSITLGSFLTKTISTHYCSHLMIWKGLPAGNCFLWASAWLALLCFFPTNPGLVSHDAHQTAQPPSWALTLSTECRSYQSIQVPWATKENQELRCHLWHW